MEQKTLKQIGIGIAVVLVLYLIYKKFLSEEEYVVTQCKNGPSTIGCCANGMKPPCNCADCPNCPRPCVKRLVNGVARISCANADGTSACPPPPQSLKQTGTSKLSEGYKVSCGNLNNKSLCNSQVGSCYWFPGLMGIGAKCKSV